MLLALILLSRLAEAEPAHVELYFAVGTPQSVLVWGRAFEGHALPSTDPAGSTTARLRRTLASFTRDEIESAEVELRLAERRLVATADREGVFRAVLPGPHAAGGGEVNARLLTPGYEAEAARVTVQVAPAGPGLLVISDIDDTVADTGVGNKRRMFWQALAGDASTMRAVPGAATAYRQLCASTPLLFVSAGPLQLHGRIARFLSQSGFPEAAVLLKKWGYGRDSERPEKSMPYKLARIRELLALFSGRRAVLIGDAGERDPEVYARIAAEQPARVAAVFIRLLGAEDQSSPRFRGQETFRDYAQALARARQLGLVAGQQATPTRPATPAASLPPATPAASLPPATPAASLPPAAPPVLARPAAPAPAATAGGRQ